MVLLMAVYEGAKKKNAGGTLGVVIRGCYLVIVVTEITELTLRFVRYMNCM